MTTFIENYLGDVTRDPQSTFQRLTPEFQAQSGGEQGYTRFWSSIRSASVSNIQADPESLVVTYSVDYVMRNNRTSSDDVRLELVYEDGTYLIAGES